ncbi:hypothetical protein BDV12DRAFT_202791 [Aspergillus spectabilis]
MGSISTQPPEHTLISLATNKLSHATKLSSLLTKVTYHHQPGMKVPSTTAETGPESAQIHKSQVCTARHIHKPSATWLWGRAFVSNAVSVDSGTMRAIVKFKLPQAIPLGSFISFQDLATRIDVPQDTLTRIIRYGITNGVFIEQPPGYIRQSTSSAALTRAKIGVAMNWNVEVPLLFAVRLFDAIPTTSSSSGSTASFNIAYNTEDTMWKFQKRHTELDKTFGEKHGY